MSPQKEEFSTPQLEADSIDKVMQEIYARHGHLAMIFDYTYDKTLDLLKEKGYGIKIKNLGETKQITVTNKGKQSEKK